jgi:hypothetical protein
MLNGTFLSNVIQTEPTKSISFEFNNDDFTILVDDIEENDVVIFTTSTPFLVVDTSIPIYYNCENDCIYYEGSPIQSGTPVLFEKNERDGGLIVSLQVLRDDELLTFRVRIVYN